MKQGVFFLFLVLVIGLGGLWWWVRTEQNNYGVNKINIYDEIDQNNDEYVNNKVFEVMAEGLEIPWSLDFLPDRRMILTERPGRIVIIGQDKQAIEVNGVAHRGEGGLLGLALDPEFSQNNFIYLYLTSLENGQLKNRVEKYKLINDELVDGQLILEGIVGANIHDGGRMAFGSDAYLYITTGDAGEPRLSQDLESLNGKILRIDREGKVVSDNPFDNEIFAYGFRNPQGLAWDSMGRLWVTDHGPSGLETGLDELNLVELGENYGWPEIRGDEIRQEMRVAQIHSGRDETWAPSGAAYYDNRIFFVGLRGETIYEYRIDEKRLERHFVNQWGRLREIIIDPDQEYVYVMTSNRDGRGRVRQDDDKIIKIRLDYFD